jgi:hypothetical protein
VRMAASRELENEAVTFRQRLLKQAAGVTGISTLLLGVVCLALLPHIAYVIALGLTLCLAVVAYLLADRPTRTPAMALVYGGSAVNAFVILVDPSAPWLVGLIEMALLLFIGGLLLGPQPCKILGGVDTLIATIALARAISTGESRPEVFLIGVACLLFYPVIFSIVPLYSRQAFHNLDILRKRLDHMELLSRELNKATVHLSMATEEISAMSGRHLEGAVQQSSAVKQVRESLHSVTASSRQIAQTAHLVFSHADRTLSNNEGVNRLVEELAAQVQNIGEVLQKISDIAGKSEVLALNAALEGTKAGAAGRGFSIVARQMQRLAEDIQGSVTHINELTEEIRAATRSTKRSMHEATKIARATTDAAHEISLVSQQQQTATEQVAHAMDDIANITSQVADGSEQTRSSTEDLADLTVRLRMLVSKLVVREQREDESSPRQPE